MNALDKIKRSLQHFATTYAEQRADLIALLRRSLDHLNAVSEED